MAERAVSSIIEEWREADRQLEDADDGSRLALEHRVSELRAEHEDALAKRARDAVELGSLGTPAGNEDS